MEPRSIQRPSATHRPRPTAAHAAVAPTRPLTKKSRMVFVELRALLDREKQTSALNFYLDDQGVGEDVVIGCREGRRVGGSGYTDDLPWTPRLTPAFKLAPRFAYLNPQLVSTALTFTLLYHPTHGATTTRPTEPRPPDPRSQDHPTHGAKTIN